MRYHSQGTGKRTFELADREIGITDTSLGVVDFPEAGLDVASE